MVILDRNVDLVPMLSHSWTYQALVNDVLEMKLNRVTVEVCELSYLATSLDKSCLCIDQIDLFNLIRHLRRVDYRKGHMI